MSTQAVKMVPAEKITVTEGHNPREDFDETALAELCESIQTHGLISALTVQEDADGGYLLVAGERRLRAARRLKITELPVLVRSDPAAKAAAIAENLIRQDLNPIEEARAFKSLAETENLRTHKKIAARVSKSAGYVSERLRLLQLPGPVQSRFASGVVPVAAERRLRQIAKVSPEAAEGLCELAADGEITADYLIEQTGSALFKLAALPESVRGYTLIPIRVANQLDELVTDPEHHASLKARIVAANRARGIQAPSYAPQDEDPRIYLDDPEKDAARAAGCLIEVTEPAQSGADITHRFLCDRKLAEDLAERAVEKLEKAATKHAAQNPASTTDVPPQELKEERRENREKAKADQEAARAHNLKLGRALIARRGQKTRREFSLDRAKTLARLLIEQNPNLAAAGLRLVLPQLQEVEAKKLKSGEIREKVTYAEPTEASQYLMDRIEEARTPQEVLELLTDAVLSALYADPRELAQSRRRDWYPGGGSVITAALVDEAKKLKLPRPKNRN